MLASGKVWSKIPQLEFPQVPVILFLLGLEYLGTVKLEYIQLEFPQVPVILFPVIQGFADVLATVKLEYQDLETRYMFIGRMSQSIYISKLWMEVLSIIKERFTRFQQLIWRALKSPLMGIFEKHHVQKCFIYVQDYDENDPKTHEGMDLTRVTTREPIAKYGLDDNTVEFIGHALELHRDDRYLNEPALDTLKRMKLYAESFAQFQGGSPYIYPLYALGELPQWAIPSWIGFWPEPYIWAK